MVANSRKKNTVPELRLRSALHDLGLRYRIHARPISAMNINADLVFRPSRVAVFVDGCFWHGCNVHGTKPSVNSDYWQAKISGNILRDRRIDEFLARAGWCPLRVWEHEPPDAAAIRVRELVCIRRPPSKG